MKQNISPASKASNSSIFFSDDDESDLDQFRELEEAVQHDSFSDSDILPNKEQLKKKYPNVFAAESNKEASFSSDDEIKIVKTTKTPNDRPTENFLNLTDDIHKAFELLTMKKTELEQEQQRFMKEKRAFAREKAKYQSEQIFAGTESNSANYLLLSQKYKALKEKYSFKKSEWMREKSMYIGQIDELNKKLKDNQTSRKNVVDSIINTKTNELDVSEISDLVVAKDGDYIRKVPTTKKYNNVIIDSIDLPNISPNVKKNSTNVRNKYESPPTKASSPSSRSNSSKDSKEKRVSFDDYSINEVEKSSSPFSPIKRNVNQLSPKAAKQISPIVQTESPITITSVPTNTVAANKITTNPLTMKNYPSAKPVHVIKANIPKSSPKSDNYSFDNQISKSPVSPSKSPSNKRSNDSFEIFEEEKEEIVPHVVTVKPPKPIPTKTQNIFGSYNVNFDVELGEVQSKKTVKSGKNIISYIDGSVETIFANGTRKITRSDCMYVFYPNGDASQDFNDGARAYKYANGSIDLTLPNNIVLYSFPSGQWEKHFPNGDKEIYYSTGEIKISKANGEFEMIFPDGSVEKHCI